MCREPASHPLEFVVLSPVTSVPVAQLSDTALLAEQTALSAERRRIDVRLAEVAGEITRRSRSEGGLDAVASRGARSPEEVIERGTGLTRREARSLSQIGVLLVDSEGDAPKPEWLDSVVAAVRAGDVGVAAADAIRVGLGEPSESVDASALTTVARQLVELAEDVGADVLAARARAERDRLDAEGVAAREEERRARRYLKLYPQHDGMTKIVGLLDPESAALVTDAFDRITSPRRHGPRFVQEREVRREEAIIADPRTTGQLVHDAFVEMVRVASNADDGAIFGVRAPSVRVHVRGEALAAREGRGAIEGQAPAVSIATVERFACATGMIPIGFDTDGQVVNVGREQRLFTARQRVGLAARDGGCVFPGCDRPASWTEAHHIDEFHAHEGKTDIADGVLLCRFHHMWVHNHGWRVVRDKADYFAVPPPDAAGRARERIPMQNRNPLRL
jgi:hypothetical protein